MQQYRVLKHISLCLGRTLENSLAECLDRPVRVLHGYPPGTLEAAREGQQALTVIHCGLNSRGGNSDREFEVVDGQEQFRNPPLLLRARYLISAWAPPPDDQELLGVVLRTFHDQRDLPTEGEEAKSVSYNGRPSISLQTISLEEHHLLGQAHGMPIQAPSVSYWVEFAIQSAKTTIIKRVKERVTDFRNIEG
jgi:Pvc16 N-terminal domain